MWFSLLLFGLGCSLEPIHPDSGTYLMTPVELDNGCGPWYDIEDFESLEPQELEIEVRRNDKELEITFHSEYPESYILDLEDNIATYSTIFQQSWSDDETYVLTQTQEWYFEWSTPTSSYGYVGIYVRCNGDCPEAAPNFGAEILPCSSNLYSSLKKVEDL